MKISGTSLRYFLSVVNIKEFANRDDAMRDITGYPATLRHAIGAGKSAATALNFQPVIVHLTPGPFDTLQGLLRGDRFSRIHDYDSLVFHAETAEDEFTDHDRALFEYHNVLVLVVWDSDPEHAAETFKILRGRPLDIPALRKRLPRLGSDWEPAGHISPRPY